MAYAQPPQAGVGINYPTPVQDNTYDVGGQQVTPWLGQLHPYSDPQHAPAPIMNGQPPNLHPITHVAQLITDHANLLRNRLLAAHMQQGLAPEVVSEHGMSMPNPLDLVHQTRQPNNANLAQLLARFQKNLRPQMAHDPMWQSEAGGDYLNPNHTPRPYNGRH